MIWNPWKRIRECETQMILATEHNRELGQTLRATRNEVARLQMTEATQRREIEALKNCVAKQAETIIKIVRRRDPKTGRYLPKGN